LWHNDDKKKEAIGLFITGVLEIYIEVGRQQRPVTGKLCTSR
jgi:hypothetical protein